MWGSMVSNMACSVPVQSGDAVGVRQLAVIGCYFSFRYYYYARNSPQSAEKWRVCNPCLVSGRIINDEREWRPKSKEVSQRFARKKGQPYC